MKKINTRIMIGDRVAIYTRGKHGTYQADYHDGGMHRRQSLKTTNLKVATKRALALAAQLEEGSLGLTKAKLAAVVRTALSEARPRFIEFKKNAGRRPKTYGKYDGTLKDFIRFAKTKNVTRVDQVDLSLIDGYQEYRSRQKVRGEKVGPTQKYHDISLLKRFLLWCADRKMTLDNPLANQKFSKPTPKRRGSSPTMEQVNTILPALPPRIHAPVAVLAFGGMRSSNCRQLLIEDVDLDEGWIHVRSREGAESKVGNEWKVPIHPRLADVLQAAPWPKSGYLFTAPPSRKYPEGGHWISTKHLNEDFVKVLKKLGIPSGRKTGFTIHSLRRFFKSFCISHGVPREYVDAWQGHASIRSASDLYVHTFDEDSQRLMKSVPFGDGNPAANAG